MEGARGDEQHVVGLHRAMLGGDGGALDQRQQVALHALARDVRPLGALARADSSSTCAAGALWRRSVRTDYGTEDKPSSAAAGSAAAASAAAGVEFRRKGNSLPRGGTAPGRKPSGESSSDSPNLTKKTSTTDDDPRILKLDDEFDVEDV